MKHVLIISAFALALGATAASACTVEYKAKKSNPTDYRHTTLSIPASECTRAKAKAYVQNQIRSGGWTVLEVVSLSG